MKNEGKYLKLELVDTKNALEPKMWAYIGVYSKKVYCSSKNRLEVLYEGKELDDAEEYYLYDIWENEEIMYTIDHPKSMTFCKKIKK